LRSATAALTWSEPPASPRSVTVAAPTCTEAGILSTLAMLQGRQAESFLQRQEFGYWCYR
jgi:thiamine biosynthesis lipoprotein